MANDGVVIPQTADISGDGAMYMKGEEPSLLMLELYAAAEEQGYVKIRLDRAWNPELTGQPWFELGYVYGEVSVRWSHRKSNILFRHRNAEAVETFLQYLADNADFAVLEVRS